MYELVDAGDGRRLERFGDRLVNRPAPAATSPKFLPGAWPEADLHFEAPSDGSPGGWRGPALGASGDRDEEGDGAWSVTLDGLQFELRPTPAGHVGMFPEQLAWRRRWAARVGGAQRSALRVLDLFAYTGAGAMYAAQAGAAVTCVDASKPAIAWARRNFEANSLDGVRSIQDDVRRFTQREIRRGQRYDLILLDPPTFGRGAQGEKWSLTKDLPELLKTVRNLLSDRPVGVLLTAHAEGLTVRRLARQFETHTGLKATERGTLDLEATSGATLSSGVFVWSGSRD